jgi:hypothetical protein
MLVRILIAVAVLLVARPASADEKPVAKSECPKDCAMRAKAAFAFAKIKAEATQAPAAAPMPKPVLPKVRLCPCGDCPCAGGKPCTCGAYCSCPDCPAKSSTSSVGGIGNAVARPQARPPAAIPQPIPKPTRERFTGSDGTIYEKGDDGIYREVPGVPGVATANRPFPQQPGYPGSTPPTAAPFATTSPPRTNPTEPGPFKGVTRTAPTITDAHGAPLKVLRQPGGIDTICVPGVG